MNLLIYSHYFAPSVGGVESIVQSLADGIAKLRTLNGDREFNVTVVTETPAGSYDDTKFPFRMVRRPGVYPAVATCASLRCDPRGWPGIFTHVSSLAIPQAIGCRTSRLSSHLSQWAFRPPTGSRHLPRSFPGWPLWRMVPVLAIGVFKRMDSRQTSSLHVSTVLARARSNDQHRGDQTR
jgi:hypothetical protein